MTLNRFLGGCEPAVLPCLQKMQSVSCNRVSSSFMSISKTLFLIKLY